MNIIEDFLQDLKVLFEMDLLNTFEIIGNAVFVTMQDGSKAKVTVNQLA